MQVSFDSHSCPGRGVLGGSILQVRRLRPREREGGRDPAKRLPGALGRGWGFSQALCARPRAVLSEWGWGRPCPPKAPPTRGPAWLSGPQTALARRPLGERRLGRRCTPWQGGRGPCPHSSCQPGPVASQTDGACESRGPPRRARLLWQPLKGLIVARPSVGCRPRRRRRQSPAFVPCPCPAPTSPTCPAFLSAGGSLGRGCLGPSDGLGRGWSVLPGCGTRHQPPCPTSAHRHCPGRGWSLA